MLANTYILVLALFTVPISVTIVEVTRKLSQYRALRKSPAFHGCEDPPCENSYDPFGILKIISVTRHFLRKTALANFAELFQKHGLTYTSIFFGQKVILTCDPRNIKHLLITRFIDFEASIVRSHIFRPITEHGIFAVDGPEWKVARDMYRNQLSNTRTVFDLQLQEKHLQAFLGRICVLDKPYDIQPLFLDLTLDLTTAFAMGESVDSLNLDQPDDKQHFVDALLYLKKQMARYGFVGPIHVLLSKRDYYKACADVKRYVERFIVEALERKRQRNQCGLLPEKAGYNLLDGLTENSDDLVSLRDGLITILIAGIDSVAGLLSTTFWLLARNDDVFHKLRAEILDHIGQEPPSYVQLRNFSYLRNVLNEAMRVYPPVPFNARIANKDTTLPHGGGEDGTSNVFVQRGQRVIFSTWAAHRSKQSFGDDALEFRPERWEHVKGESLGFIPFNSGPRACPGQQYALMEASYVTVRILQTFSKITNCDPRPWKEKMGLNLFNEHGVVVEFGK
ncbi:MAG: hypothetical protein LQ338_007682 [Usnochroma carphineum]|nr:MAG: hypothetical protein LQ338_007682 [Usnochroma carphineum]